MLKKTVSWLWFIGNFIWGCVNAAVTYATLPEDIEEFWRENMMGSPNLPWVMAALGLVLLAWI